MCLRCAGDIPEWDSEVLEHEAPGFQGLESELGRKWGDRKEAGSLGGGRC